MAESDVSAAHSGTKKSSIGCPYQSDASGADWSHDDGMPGSGRPGYQRPSSHD